jgi:hypothetical protein
MSNFDDDAFLSKVNAQMSVSPFMSGPDAEHHWHSLLCKIEQLRRPGDTFHIPEPNAAGAWGMAFAVYERFRDRSRLPRSPEQISNALRNQEMERVYNEFLDNLAHLVTLTKRDVLDKQTLSYIGLREGDLASPAAVDNNTRGDGRRPDWQDVAYRVSGARGRWERMSREEKLAMPLVMSSRRTEAALQKMEEKYNALEQRCNELEQRIGALDTPNKQKAAA